MKKILVVVLALVSLTASAQSLDKKKGSKKKAAHTEVNALLYRVSGNGLKQDSYIFGTVHAICQNDLQLGDSVHACLKRSKKLVLEADESKMDPNEMMSKMMMKGDTSVSMLLSKEEYKRVDDFFTKELNLGFSRLQNLKPLMISSLTVLNMMPCPATEISGVEKVLSVMAKSYQVGIEELEGASYQFALMDSIPYTLQAKALLTGVDSFELQKKQLSSLLEAYKKQDLNELSRIIQIQSLSDLNYDELLMEKRNLLWIPKIEKMTKAQSCFIAVGAGHLVGEKGILHLLKQAGYRVEPIYSN